jgi:hypothetical protein
MDLAQPARVIVALNHQVDKASAVDPGGPQFARLGGDQQPHHR